MATISSGDVFSQTLNNMRARVAEIDLLAAVLPNKTKRMSYYHHAEALRAQLDHKLQEQHDRLRLRTGGKRLDLFILAAADDVPQTTPKEYSAAVTSRHAGYREEYDRAMSEYVLGIYQLLGSVTNHNIEWVDQTLKRIRQDIDDSNPK